MSVAAIPDADDYAIERAMPTAWRCRYGMHAAITLRRRHADYYAAAIRCYAEARYAMMRGLMMLLRLLIIRYERIA